MRQPKPRDLWLVYGDYRLIGSIEKRRVANNFDNEESAWRNAIELRLRSEVCNLVIVHQTPRPGIKDFAGKWRAMHGVIWRTGNGKAWFEP